jgi:hypothetical protein
MSEENRIRDTVDAVTGLAKAVPIYQDALQPAVREVGTGLQTVAKTIHIALAPISALVWGFEKLQEFVSTRVAEKLKDVPAERIQTPDPHVVGPALEALRYVGHEDSLCELYANLLATSLDGESASKAHPAFVGIINSMAPDEARIMRLFAAGRAFPVIDVHKYADPAKGEYTTPLTAFSRVGLEAGCSHNALTPSYLDNLARLGLIESPGGSGPAAPVLSAPDTYEPLEETFNDYKESVEAAGGRIAFNRRMVQLTNLGLQFCKACVIEKGAPADSTTAP